MDIFLIFARDTVNGEPWLVDAWDEYSVDENASGFADAKQKAYDENGAENVRILKTTIGYDAVKQAFEPQPIASTSLSED